MDIVHAGGHSDGRTLSPHKTSRRNLNNSARFKCGDIDDGAEIHIFLPHFYHM